MSSVVVVASAVPTILAIRLIRDWLFLRATQRALESHGSAGGRAILQLARVLKQSER
jgi:hypothetical protein